MPAAKLDRVSGSGSRPKRGQQVAVVPAAEEASGPSSGAGLAAAAGAAPPETGGGSSTAELLATALEAINTLALALTAAEADAANEQAVRAVLPLLRAASSCSDKVEVVRAGIKLLHAAAVKGDLAEPGLQEKVQEALRCLASEVGTSAVAEAGKRKAPESSSCSNRKQQRISVEAGDSTAMTIDEIPCQVCGISEGSDMLICDWCAASAGHLGCLGFTEVPTDSWFCSSTCEVHRDAAVAAGAMHGRWVLGTVSGVNQPFWGQLSYVAYGVLKIRDVDGEVYQGVRVAHLLGQERMVEHQGLLLQPEACTVPAGVLKVFEEKKWLV